MVKIVKRIAKDFTFSQEVPQYVLLCTPFCDGVDTVPSWIKYGFLSKLDAESYFINNQTKLEIWFSVHLSMDPETVRDVDNQALVEVKTLSDILQITHHSLNESAKGNIHSLPDYADLDSLMR